METYALGMNAKMYHGTAGTTAATEAGNIRDANLNMETGESDVTTRANNGWRATAATLKECTVDFEMVWNPSDPFFTAIKNAFLQSKPLALKILDKTGGQGPDGDFSITSFSRGEPLEEAIIVNVTAKMVAFRTWIEGT